MQISTCGASWRHHKWKSAISKDPEHLRRPGFVLYQSDTCFYVDNRQNRSFGSVLGAEILPFCAQTPKSLCNHMYMPLAGPLCKILGSIPGSLRPLGEPIGPLECPRAPAGSRAITQEISQPRRHLNQWPGGVFAGRLCVDIYSFVSRRVKDAITCMSHGTSTAEVLRLRCLFE